MTKEEILFGIRGFSYEQETLLRLIRKSSNGLTDTKFDKLFSGNKETVDSNGNITVARRLPKIRVTDYQRGAFILPFREWEKHLHLLQLMCKAGLVKADIKDGHVTYRIP